MLVYKSVLSSGEGGGLSLDNLEITSPATKVTYIKGDSIDLSGLVVTGTLGNMQGDVTSDCTVSPSVFNTLGTQTITLSYGGLSVSYDVVVTNGLRIVPWATGTDLEIVAMLNAFYNDELDIYSCEGWEIGAEREVALSAMPATGVSETHVAQTVKLMLLDKGVRTLATPINGHTNCAFVVGQSDVLNNNGTTETGHINSKGGDIGWKDMSRRTWCNSVYRDAFPETLKPIFKQFNNTAIAGYNRTPATETVVDYFTLPAVSEYFPKILNTNSWCRTSEGSAFEVFDNMSASGKVYPRYKNGHTYWLRSVLRSGLSSGSPGGIYSSNGYNVVNSGFTSGRGIAPLGVI